MNEELIKKCNERFNKMDVWYIVDNFEQLKILKSILWTYQRKDPLSKRQAVRLFDFSEGLSMYQTYTKEQIIERYKIIKNSL